MTIQQQARERLLYEAFENGDVSQPKCPITEHNVDELYEMLIVRAGLHSKYNYNLKDEGR